MEAEDKSISLALKERTNIVASSCATYFRSIFLYNTATVLFADGHIVPSALMIYDALLQLGIGMFLCDFENWNTLQLTNDTLRKDIRRAIRWMRESREDPARGLSRKGVLEFLAERKKTYSFVAEFSDAFCKLVDVRDFVHYGPRLRQGDKTLLFDTCKYPKEELRPVLEDHIEKGERLFNAYYQFLSVTQTMDPVVLHTRKYEELFLYASDGLSGYYSTDIKKKARTLHAKLRKLLPYEWGCRCSEITV